MNITNLDELPCATLKGIGPKLSAVLAKRHIHTVQDLLFHLPFRYQDRTHVTPLRDLRFGDYAVIEGVITKSLVIRAKRLMLTCDVKDGSGHITLRFFHFNKQQMEYLKEGTRIRCFGEVRHGVHGQEMIHPEYRCLQPGAVLAVEETLTPIYPTTEGLSQVHLRRLTDFALGLLAQGAVLHEHLPESLLEEYQLPRLSDAIRFIHRPPPDVSLEELSQGKHPMQQRLVLEELIAHQLTLLRLRDKVKQQNSYALSSRGTFTEIFLKNLPFELTNAQKRVVSEIYEDIKQPHPMLRLVQGDVGCGKTLVAALAMLSAVESGAQAALMAPTEILAEQHYQTFTQWFSSQGLGVTLLTGKLKAKEKREALEVIASGASPLVIGTHALFQETVEFQKLALLVVDEQHRFGVHQRLSLREKGNRENVFPHQLIMTATPIPRTLAMTAYADLDYSVIDELPPGRKSIKTVAIGNKRREDIIARVQSFCEQKHQVYWVCTLIEESEVLQCQAAEVTATELQAQLPHVTVGLVHGRMTSTEKEDIMRRFKLGEVDLLVATTVIEVGVDVPNASLMVIENPERLGLAQLHQLRGRVGRGVEESHCVLLYQSPLSETAQIRLQALRETQDGFELAKQDLLLRGPGEVLGTRQTGEMRFRIVDIVRDARLIPSVKRAALFLLESHPDKVDLLIRRWLQEKEQYAQV